MSSRNGGDQGYAQQGSYAPSAPAPQSAAPYQASAPAPVPVQTPPAADVYDEDIPF